MCIVFLFASSVTYFPYCFLEKNGHLFSLLVYEHEEGEATDYFELTHKMHSKNFIAGKIDTSFSKNNFLLTYSKLLESIDIFQFRKFYQKAR